MGFTMWAVGAPRPLLHCTVRKVPSPHAVFNAQSMVWSPQETAKLLEEVQRHGTRQWNVIAEALPNRCAWMPDASYLSILAITGSIHGSPICFACHADLQSSAGTGSSEYRSLA